MSNLKSSGESGQKKYGVLQMFYRGHLKREFVVTDTSLVIGRSPQSDIIVPSQSASHRHAKVKIQNGKVVLKDLGSAEGVLVDGVPIVEHELNYDERFSIAEYDFCFIASAESSSHEASRKGHSGQADTSYSSKSSNSLSDTVSGVLPATFSRHLDSEGLFLISEVKIAVQKHWRIVLSAITVSILVGLFHARLAQPIFQTNAMIQIEERLRKIGGPLNEFDNKQSWNDSLADQAEILTSRTVLGEVVDRLGLAIVVEPDYFPLIGKPLARVRGEREVVASPLIGSQRFAWGGESWQIQAMEIPEKFLSKSFELVVGRQGSFKLYDEENGFLAAGTVGEEVLDFLPTSDRSRILITALVANPGTVFKVKKIPRLEAIQRLQRRLVVADGGEDSSTLAISLDGQDPKRIAEILNVVVNLYVANDVERQSREARLTLNFVEQQIPGVRAALEEAEGRLNRLQSQRGSVDITSDTQTVLSKIVRLESRLGELRQSRAELIQRFTPLHPRIQSLDSQIAAQEQQLAAAEGDVKELPTTQREILSATRNVNVASDLYLNLMNRAQELRVVSDYASTASNVRIVDYPNVPLRPYKPNKSLLLLLYIMLGGGASIGLIIFNRMHRDVLFDPGFIEESLGIPVLAALPHSNHEARLGRQVRPDGPAARFLSIARPNDLVVENLRGLRTSLQFGIQQTKSPVLMIAGPTEGIGKTFVASNLAALLAISGRRTVLVDSDFRRGAIHTQLGLEREPGFADILTGELKLEEVVNSTQVDGLDIITAGAVHPNPSELLMSPNFEASLQLLAEKYDHVIIDTPPLLAVTDPAIISKQAGVILLVLKSGTHTRRVIEQSLKRLSGVGSTVSGVVFNDMAPNEGAAYGYSITYAYGEK